MNNLNTKCFIWLLLVISGIAWFLIATYQELNLSSVYDYFKPLPAVVTIDVFLAGIFFRWAWKLPIFKTWLVPFPNLSGTWQGVIRSTWKDPSSNDQLDPIPAILTIKQHYLEISCVVRTAEMTSVSYSANFNLESNGQVKQICFSYASQPRPTVINRSPMHEGSARLDVIDSPERKLKGSYWTSRETTGEIEMTFREKKLLQEFPDDLGSHPQSVS